MPAVVSRVSLLRHITAKSYSTFIIPLRDASDELPKRPGFLLWHMISILTGYLYLYHTSLSRLYFSAFGVAGGIRTLDLLSHNQTFYQLNYSHMAARVGFEPTHGIIRLLP